jgi:hypothetical protein
MAGSHLGFYFGNREIKLPGVYSQVNAEAMNPNRGVASRAVAVIAVGEGGAVGSFTRITGSDQIATKLIGGDLRRLTEIVMAPSGELVGANDVYAIRVNAAVAATRSTGDGTLTAKTAGKIGNGLAVKRLIASGKTDLYLKHAYLGIEEKYLGLGPVLEIEYVGGGTPTTKTVAVTGTTDKTLTLTRDAEIDVITSDMAPTVDDLLTAINNTTNWAASLVGNLRAVPTNDVLTQSYTLTSDKTQLAIGAKALEYALADSQLATFVANTSAATAINNFSYFSGGSEGGTVDFNAWQAAINRATDLDLHSIVIGTGDEAVIVAAKAHVETRGDALNRKECLLFVGPAKAGSKSALLTSLQNLSPGVSSKVVTIAGSEPILINAATNKREAYPAYYLAAAMAGMKAGNRPETPLTNKQVSIFGTSYEWSRDELETLISLGAVPLTKNAQGQYTIVQGITSWTKDANVIYRKIAGMDIAQYLNKTIRIRLERFIGQVGDEVTVTQIRDAVVGFLAAEVRNANNREGVLTAGVNIQTGEPQAAFRNVEVVMDGFDLVGIRYEANPVGEIAYITATAYLTPVKIVAVG